MKNILFIAFISLFSLSIFATEQTGKLLPKYYIEDLEGYLKGSPLPWLLNVYTKRNVTKEELDSLVEKLSKGEIGFNLKDFGVPSIHNVIPNEYNSSRERREAIEVYPRIKKLISKLLGEDLFNYLDLCWSQNYYSMSAQDQDFMNLFIVYKLVESLDNRSHPSYKDWENTPYFRISSKNKSLFIHYTRKKQFRNLVTINPVDVLEIKKQAISFLMLLFRSDIVFSENLNLLDLILSRQFPSYIKSLNEVEKLIFIAIIQRELEKIIPENEKESLNKEYDLLSLIDFTIKQNPLKSSDSYKDYNRENNREKANESDLDFLFFLMDKYRELMKSEKDHELVKKEDTFLTQLSYIRDSKFLLPATALPSHQLLDSQEILLNFIIKILFRLLNSTDMIQNQSLMKAFHSKLVESGIFKNTQSAQYFKTTFIETMAHRSSICRLTSKDTHVLNIDYYAYNTTRHKTAFLTYLRHFKNISQKYMKTADHTFNTKKKPIKVLRKIREEDLNQSLLLKHEFSSMPFEQRRDPENYQIYLYKIIKEVSKFVQETDLMMPYNKVLRDRVFQKLNQIILDNQRKNSDLYVCVIYSELKQIFKMTPELSDLLLTIRKEEVNLQIYADFYSYFLVKNYPDIKVKGVYKPLKFLGKTIVPEKLDRPYDTQILDLMMRIQSSNGEPESLEDISNTLHKLLVTTTFLDDTDTLFTIYTILTDSPLVNQKLHKYILKNLTQLAIERGYLNESDSGHIIENGTEFFLRLMEVYRYINPHSEQIFEVLHELPGY
jgi:hypothetical protein